LRLIQNLANEKSLLIVSVSERNGGTDADFNRGVEMDGRNGRELKLADGPRSRW